MDEMRPPWGWGTRPSGTLKSTPRPSSPTSLLPAGHPELQPQQRLSLHSMPGQRGLRVLPGHWARLGLRGPGSQCPMRRPDMETLPKAKHLGEHLGELSRQVFQWLRFCPAPTLLCAHRGGRRSILKAGMVYPRPTAAPPSTHHGDVLHLPRVVLGRGGGLGGGPLPEGAGQHSCLLRGQVGIADVVLRGLEHLEEEARVPLLQKVTSPSAALPPPPPASPAAPPLSLPHLPLLPGCFQQPLCSSRPGSWEDLDTWAHGLSDTFEPQGPWETENKNRGGMCVWYIRSDPRDSLTCCGGIPAAKRQKQPELESSS